MRSEKPRRSLRRSFPRRWRPTFGSPRGCRRRGPLQVKHNSRRERVQVRPRDGLRRVDQLCAAGRADAALPGRLRDPRRRADRSAVRFQAVPRLFPAAARVQAQEGWYVMQSYGVPRCVDGPAPVCDVLRVLLSEYCLLSWFAVVRPR